MLQTTFFILLNNIFNLDFLLQYENANVDILKCKLKRI